MRRPVRLMLRNVRVPGLARALGGHPSLRPFVWPCAQLCAVSLRGKTSIPRWPDTNPVFCARTGGNLQWTIDTPSAQPACAAALVHIALSITSSLLPQMQNYWHCTCPIRIQGRVHTSLYFTNSLFIIY